MKKVIKNHVIYWFPVYVWAVLILYFSLAPSTSPLLVKGAYIAVSDYYKHVLVYGFFTLLLWRAFRNSKFKYPKALAIMTTIFYGVNNELCQHFIPGRNFSLYDIFFDFIGSVLVQPLISFYKNLKG